VTDHRRARDLLSQAGAAEAAEQACGLGEPAAGHPGYQHERPGEPPDPIRPRWAPGRDSRAARAARAERLCVRTAWESLLLVANGHATKRESHGHRVDRQTLRIIDLHWHDLRHEGACRLLADGVDLRAIQLILGHSDVKQTQRYLNVTDEELRKTLSELWQRRRNAQRGRRRMSRKHSGVRVPDRGGNSLSRAV
jgi:hypothetical protein